MADQPDGCACETFTEALEAFTIQREGDVFYLGNREVARGSWYTVVYGPQIAFCPFCGTKLAVKPKQT